MEIILIMNCFSLLKQVIIMTMIHKVQKERVLMHPNGDITSYNGYEP